MIVFLAGLIVFVVAGVVLIDPESPRTDETPRVASGARLPQLRARGATEGEFIERLVPHDRSRRR
jgi:hypothetical protein